MQGRVTLPTGSVVCWEQLKYSAYHRSSLDVVRSDLNMMVRRFQDEHCKRCTWSNVCINGFYYMEKSVLLGTKPLVNSIRRFIRDPSGVFSVCHLCECRIVQ